VTRKALEPLNAWALGANAKVTVAWQAEESAEQDALDVRSASMAQNLLVVIPQAEADVDQPAAWMNRTDLLSAKVEQDAPE
jgi:hypothetical protein